MSKEMEINAENERCLSLDDIIDIGSIRESQIQDGVDD